VDGQNAVINDKTTGILARLECYIQLAEMFSFIRNDNGSVRISNRIFESCLYNLFTTECTMERIYKEGSIEKNRFIADGMLNMKYIIERFVIHYNDIYGPNGDRFKEDDGRRLFLLYLRPIINGSGNYYVEAEIRDETRTDIVVDYLGNQYVIELKIWRGNSYNERGEKQLADYLDYFHVYFQLFKNFLILIAVHCGADSTRTSSFIVSGSYTN